FGHPCDAAIDVADEECSGVSGSFSQFVLCFEQRAGERSMGVGIDQSAEGSCLIISRLGDVAAGKHGHRAQKMVRVLLVDRALDPDLAPRMAIGAFQTDADSADA